MKSTKTLPRRSDCSASLAAGAIEGLEASSHGQPATFAGPACSKPFILY